MKLILKGMLIGIGKIIPGVSGSVIAISLGVYKQAIKYINNFFSDVKTSAKYLSLLGIGIIISISFFSNIIFYLLNNYYVLTMSLFIGFILGSNKHIRVKNNKYNYISLISFSLVLLFGLFSGKNNISFNNTFFQIVYMFLIGMVEAATMIIPGISGTVILMMLGAYELILKTYSNIFNITLVIDNLLIIIPFCIGIIIGIYFISKMINYLFINYQEQTNKAITGFLYGTIVYIIVLCCKEINCVSEVVLGSIALFLGYLIIKKIS